jgi:hypothetical protein
MIDLSIRSRFSWQLYQASCYNQFNPSSVVHLDGQPSADIQAGRMAASWPAASWPKGGPEPARPPSESAYDYIQYSVVGYPAYIRD